jgi:hypothetical protein
MAELRHKYRTASTRGIVFATLMAIFAYGVPANVSTLPAPIPSATNLATIKGIVRDQTGSPIADATVAIFRLGTAKLLKQVRSGRDGSFLAKINPGKYTILAVAEGFNPVTLAEVQVNSASLANYGFRLERAGGGNTLPDKRLDRNNPKWLIRSGMLSRGTYQIDQGSTPGADVAVEESAEIAADDNNERRNGKPTQTVVETFAAASEGGNYAGLNFATAVPIGSADAVFAAQTGIGRNAPLRLESQVKFAPFADHQIRLKAGYAKLGEIEIEGVGRELGQFSLQATDQWNVREGIVLVYGFDYSKFVGAGGDFSLNPRLGFQFDVDSKTRLRSAFTSLSEDRSWTSEIELEDAQVIFREPVAIDDIAIEAGKPVMNRSSRFEIGIERVLDNRSSLELNAFFDTTFARGVGYSAMALSPAGDVFNELTGNQQGNSQGLRVVYSRRLSGILSTSAGYSFGSGQRLSQDAITDPESLFESGYFHTAFGQLDADFNTGTSVRTVFRLSPEATVFAIDPFQGRLAIYDPSLSVLVTQNLPSLGLPFRAVASVDARNILGFHSGIENEFGTLRLNSHRRVVRGSIRVRF